MLLAAGVLLLSLRGGRDLAALDRRAVGFALFTAVTICAYSVVDGIGARRPARQCQRLFRWPVRRHRAGDGWSTRWCGAAPRCIPTMVPHWKIGLGGGVLAVISYSIAIWAMTVAPIAIVAALRETSVLFGAHHRRGVPEGAAARGAHRRGADDRRGLGAAAALI